MWVPFLRPEGGVSGREPRSLSARPQGPIPFPGEATHSPQLPAAPQFRKQGPLMVPGTPSTVPQCGSLSHVSSSPKMAPNYSKAAPGCSSFPWEGHLPPPSPSRDCFFTPHSREPIGTSLIPTPAAGNSTPHPRSSQMQMFTCGQAALRASPSELGDRIDGAPVKTGQVRALTRHSVTVCHISQPPLPAAFSVSPLLSAKAQNSFYPCQSLTSCVLASWPMLVKFRILG